MTKQKKKTPKNVADVIIVELMESIPEEKSSEDMVNKAKTIQYISESIRQDKRNKLDPNVWVPVAVTTAGGVIIYAVNWYLSGDRVIDWKIMEAAKRFFGRK